MCSKCVYHVFALPCFYGTALAGKHVHPTCLLAADCYRDRYSRAACRCRGAKAEDGRGARALLCRECKDCRGSREGKAGDLLAGGLGQSAGREGQRHGERRDLLKQRSCVPLILGRKVIQDAAFLLL